MKYALVGITLFALGCGFENGAVQSIGQGDSPTLVARHGAVIADGCTLDGWQRDVLSSPGARKVLREVILLCGTPRETFNYPRQDHGEFLCLSDYVEPARDGKAVDSRSWQRTEDGRSFVEEEIILEG